jgi:hypothetical protein
LTLDPNPLTLNPKILKPYHWGMILMYAKEGINESLLNAGIGPTLAGIVAGAGGGAAHQSSCFRV